MNIPSRRAPTTVPTLVAPQPPHLFTPPDAYSDGSPIFLSGSVKLRSGNNGAPNTAALRNPTPHYIEISEIRFNTKVEDFNCGIGIAGVSLLISFDGQTSYPITNGYVPLWSFDKSENLLIGEYAGGNPRGGPGNQSVSSYVWRLRNPIQIPPGGIIIPDFKHFGLTVADITMWIGYAGRVIVNAPTARPIVPYVAFYDTKAVDTNFLDNQATVDYESTELDLINNSTEIVHVHTLTGRLLTVNSAFSDISDEVQPMIDPMCFVRLRTSKGYEITKDYVPFRLLFARDTRAFPCDIILDPNDQILAQVQLMPNGVYTDNAGAYPSIVAPLSAHIAMIGERSI